MVSWYPPTHARVQACRLPVTALVTVEAFQPQREGIKNATVARTEFLIGPVPVTVDPRKESNADDDHDHDHDHVMTMMIMS